MSVQGNKATAVEIPVRSSDIDGQGIVNNAIYFTYFEHARMTHLRRLGIIRGYRDPEGHKHMIVLAATEARFRSPVRFPETLRVVARTSEVRTRSFTVAHEAFRLSDGVRVAEGTAVAVWVNEQGHAVPLPDAVRQTLLDSQNTTEGTSLA